MDYALHGIHIMNWEQSKVTGLEHDWYRSEKLKKLYNYK